MDVSDTFDSQQSGGGGQQQPQQPPLVPGQQMQQCGDPMVTFGPQPFDGSHGPLGGPIPLPAPPQNYDKGRSNAADIDFDSLLLQQFSCLGTRDHEDLIEQFHSLMNNQMNKDAARFFLEMSNW